MSQTCTYVPPAPALTLDEVKATCTMCHGLTVNTTVLKSGGYTAKGRTAAQWLTTVNTMVGYACTRLHCTGLREFPGRASLTACRQ